MEKFLERRIYGYKLWEVLLVLVALGLLLYCIRGFLGPIFLGFIIGYILLPIYNKINKLVKKRVAAACITLALFYLPLLFMAWQIFNWFIQELVSMYLQLASLHFPKLGGLFSLFNPAAIVWSVLKKISEFFSKFTIYSPSTVLKLLIDFVLVVVISFFVLLEGSSWRKALLKSLPKEKRITLLKFIKRLDEVYYNIFVVQFYVALIVFVLALIFFYLVGAKYVLIYSAACFIFALIPIFDAWMVCLLVSMFAFLKGQLLKALLISTLGSFLLSVVPGYIIRPKLAQKKARVHGGLIFVAYLIGPFVFGPIGFLAVPAIFGFFQVALEMVLKKPKEA
ncbi:MAG: AI-2E family transporter [bacterium]|nr:AI-2E family transporter [bacterium]